MDGLVVGNQIQCYSPAAKEVPQIITENGERPPEAELGGRAVLLPGGELRTDTQDGCGGIEGAFRRGGSEEGVWVGGDVAGRRR